MKIGGYQSVSLCDFEGHVAAVVFTQGCNFRCPFCHNASLLPAEVDPAHLIPEEHVLDRLRLRHGFIDAVVVSGGEPTLQPDLPRFLRILRRMEFLVKLDTNGSRPEILRVLLREGLLDYVAMDIKAPWPKYGILAGVSVPTHSITESIRLIADSGLPHEFRTTLAPGLREDEDLVAIRQMIPAGSPHKTQPFHPAAGSGQPAAHHASGVTAYSGDAHPGERATSNSRRAGF